jgi:deaminated glutathione amidase
VSTLVAVAQMTSNSDRAANRDQATRLIRQAADRGAEAVFLPEAWPFIGSDADKLAGAETLQGPTMSAMAELAASLGIWLFPGSFAEISPIPDRVFNTSPVFGPDGALRAVYRKIHLFDVDLPGSAVTMESDVVAAGDQAVVVATPLGRVGLSICYDLRFASLYEALGRAGADVVTVPSAFTVHTGKDHWEVLLRARAIEQQVWVVAADQGGQHNRKRRSWGHSMIVDPWGHVVARCSDGPGLALALLDLDVVERTRRQLPCAEHRRSFAAPQDA